MQNRKFIVIGLIQAYSARVIGLQACACHCWALLQSYGRNGAVLCTALPLESSLQMRNITVITYNQTQHM